MEHLETSGTKVMNVPIVCKLSNWENIYRYI